ncbi:hypothetical protein DR996_02535 [Vibrio owensii]|nr:hypothetical protein DR996_02535 [Vibrio owensii]
MNLMITIVMVGLTAGIIYRLFFSTDIIKKWSLILLLCLSMFLRIVGYTDSPTDAEQFLWFIYDAGMMFWIYYALIRKTPPSAL